MIEKVSGIVIKTKDYGETHKIVTLFTKEKGKIGLVARGAKKPRSSMAAVTQPFVYGLFMIQSGRNLGSLLQGEVIDSMREIKEDLMKTAYVSYLAELTDKVLDSSEPDPYLWDQFLQSLERISEDETAEFISMIYEMKLYEKGGFAPTLRGCVSCGKTEHIAHFSIQEGGFLCATCRHQDSEAMFLNEKLVKILQLIRYINVSRVGKISIKKESRKLLRDLLDSYYDRYGGYYLKSRNFLKQMDKFEL
ncbi:DNA repair protein RecO [Salirhabdus salicampi]|uniref:DNA repair protein RecO n=1 Tax=Salirhabdus salicampi TaxID=476102 RepID=UPI0020C5135C|nr:DNA repair protein RecO [Salirhabdus salicampi]